MRIIESRNMRQQVARPTVAGDGGCELPVEHRVKHTLFLPAGFRYGRVCDGLMGASAVARRIKRNCWRIICPEAAKDVTVSDTWRIRASGASVASHDNAND